jgi:hypothetical protein
MSKRLNSGDTVTVAAVTEIIRPATKRLNRISDLNVCAITTGQLRWGANTLTGGVPSSPANPEQNGPHSFDLIPNTSSIQLLAYDNTAGIDLLEKIKEDLSYIDAMVV